MAHYQDRPGLGVGAGSEIWEQELVRYPEWPRALVLSQRAVWLGRGSHAATRQRGQTRAELDSIMVEMCLVNVRHWV